MQYQDFNAIIKKNDPGLSAAESHGMATGMLCVYDSTETGFWLRELFADSGELNVDDRAALENLFDETKALLLEDEFTFELLLPGTELPLCDQIDALRSWCQGFLYGIGSTSQSANWSADSRELIKDIAEFTKLDSNTDGEDAENAFMEITEYLRTAVIFLRTDLYSGGNCNVH